MIVMASERWLPLFIFLTLTTHFAFVTSQLEAVVCLNNGNYTSESLYKIDLSTLLRSLSSNIRNNGFYSASVDEANAIALCRADIQLSQCRGCVDIVAADIVQRCPNQYQAIMWQKHCMVRYSNEAIFGILANKPAYYVQSLDSVEGGRDQFNKVREMLIDDLRAEASNGGLLRKAAAGNRSATANQTIYAMVQCTPDLSPENCTSCLVDAAQYMSDCCSNTPAIRIYMPSCTIRYETQRFYNITRLREPLEPSSSPSTAGNNRTRNIILIVVSIVVFLTVAFGISIFARKKMKQKNEISTTESIKYDFGEIRAATNDFADANKLGQGGFGTVYKGVLKTGQEIAVKRLSNNSGQGDPEFKNEVLLVARLHHKNLVKLLGFSLEEKERLLVYELVHNGSLDHFIDPSSNLNWSQRYEIIQGIARGLLYLHEDSNLRIIHRDLKTSNILLDIEMNPKISDFSIAKPVGPDATHETTTRIFGTHGYMAPEYAFGGHFSIKSDAFSFGVLVLQIVTGQKNICLPNEKNPGEFLSNAWRTWKEGKGTSMIESVLMTNSECQQDMLRCIHIALLCVQENPNDRPTMASVVAMLNILSDLPSPSEPGFYIPTSISGPSLEYNSK